MILTVNGLLDPAQVAHFRSVLDSTPWVDGKATAGALAALAKNNLQIPENAPEVRPLRETILERLAAVPAFGAAALPARIFPPQFNRYDAGMTYGAHIDNAIRYDQNRTRYRMDLSCTLFLTPPEDYDGGELVIEGAFGTQSIKLPAGSLVLYPSTTVHRVMPVTRGSRWASFFWLQSLVRDGGQRDLLFELDRSITSARATLGDDHASVVGLTGAYHNLLRMWVEG